MSPESIGSLACPYEVARAKRHGCEMIQCRLVDILAGRHGSFHINARFCGDCPRTPNHPAIKEAARCSIISRCRFWWRIDRRPPLLTKSVEEALQTLHVTIKEPKANVESLLAEMVARGMPTEWALELHKAVLEPGL